MSKSMTALGVLFAVTMGNLFSPRANADWKVTEQIQYDLTVDAELLDARTGETLARRRHSSRVDLPLQQVMPGYGAARVDLGLELGKSKAYVTLNSFHREGQPVHFNYLVQAVRVISGGNGFGGSLMLTPGVAIPYFNMNQIQLITSEGIVNASIQVRNLIVRKVLVPVKPVKR